MKIKLYKHEEMLFALLRSSLTQNAADVSVFEGATPEEWRKCYLLAEQQGVKALAWDGVVTLPKDRRPNKQLFLNWALAVEKYEHIYEHHCSTIAKLSDFYSQHGISTMQMKGVAFSVYYPRPEHREGGDIDIYTYSSDLSAMSNEQANELADELMRRQGIYVEFPGYKHTVFMYDGIEIENHKCFLNVKTNKISASIEKVLKEVLNPVKVSILDGKYTINVPSDSFNTLFISFHAMQHTGDGLTLHHLCDWACILNRCGMDIPSEISNENYHRALAMFNTFVSRFFGCEAPTSCSESDLEKFFWLIMRSTKERTIETHNPVKIIYLKLRHLYRYAIMRNIILGEPITKKYTRALTSHLKNPARIFSKK